MLGGKVLGGREAPLRSVTVPPGPFCVPPAARSLLSIDIYALFEDGDTSGRK